MGALGLLSAGLGLLLGGFGLLLGGLGLLVAGLGLLLCVLGLLLGCSWGALGCSWGDLGVLLDAFWGALWGVVSEVVVCIFFGGCVSLRVCLQNTRLRRCLYVVALHGFCLRVFCQCWFSKYLYQTRLICFLSFLNPFSNRGEALRL